MMGISAAEAQTVPAPKTADLLEVDGLAVHFATPRGLLHAVDGVSLEVQAGETLAVVGESGSGKSVTGLAVMRLLERTSARIAGGRVGFRGKDGVARDLLRLPETAMRRVRGREIAMIFQDPLSSLNPVFTIGDQIVETLRRHHRLSRAAAQDRAGELLAQVGIAGAGKRLSDYPHQLSGGMRQRVVIAIALACDPLLLIADEPTTALDVTIQAQIVDLLKRLQRERRMGMIFVTHDLGLVEEVADRVAVMYAGQIVEQGPAEDLLARPRHPYTQALLDCNPHRALSRLAEGTRPDLLPIPGAPADPVRPPHGCRFHPRCRLRVEDCTRAVPPMLQPAPGRGSRCIRHEELA
ncbi:MAG: ABC transporter ATP-binding protein [Geminicoccaceae bacterium]|nr:ABC transporter ATP-binding protein [Geminicoccaceae bacterium]